MARFLPHCLLAALLLSIGGGILFSKSGVGEGGDFSHQYFLSLADALAPSGPLPAASGLSLLRAQSLLATNQLSATFLPDSGALRVVSEQGAMPAMLFRGDYYPAKGTIPVLRIRTGEMSGSVPHNRVLNLTLYWSTDANFSMANSISFQLMAHSQTILFMGRKQSDLQGPVFLRLDLPTTEKGQSTYEFLNLDVFSIDKQYLAASYPPNLNYGGIFPAAAKRMAVAKGSE